MKRTALALALLIVLPVAFAGEALAAKQEKAQKPASREGKPSPYAAWWKLAPFRIPVTPRWMDNPYAANVTTPCCSFLRAHLNATDPDNTGLYDSARFTSRANSTASNATRAVVPFPYPFPPRYLPFPIYDAFLTANFTGFDSTTNDVFDTMRADANATWRSPRHGNLTLRLEVRCANAGPSPGPESCTLMPVYHHADAPS